MKKRNYLISALCIIFFAGVSLLHYSGKQPTRQTANKSSIKRVPKFLQPQNIKFMIPSAKAAAYDGRLTILADEDLVIGTTTTQIMSAVSPLAVMAAIFLQGDTARFKLYSLAERNNGAVLDEGDLIFLDEADEVKYFNTVLDEGSSAATAYVVLYKIGG